MKDTSVIPRGLYCYKTIDGKQINCPYWSRLTQDSWYQEDGYCAFLEQSDWDINEEIGMLEGNQRSGKAVISISAHEIKMSLLWDQCKMCDIKVEE